MSAITRSAFVVLVVGCGLAIYPLVRARSTPGAPRPFVPRLSVVTETQLGAAPSHAIMLASFANHVRSLRGPSQFDPDHASALIDAAAGDIPSAVSRLSELVARHRDGADEWLDLSAALLLEAKGNTNEPASLYAASLDASLRANRLKPSAAAAFNAALAWSALGMHEAAEAAWNEALRSEEDNAWRIEISRHLDEAHRINRDRNSNAPSWERFESLSNEQLAAAVQQAMQPWREFVEEQALPLWADPAQRVDRRELALEHASRVAKIILEASGDGCLNAIIEEAQSADHDRIARAIRLYAAGRQAYEASRRENAVELFHQALAEIEDDDAFASRVNVQLANSLYQVARYAEAETLARRNAIASRRHSCWSCEAASIWLVGVAETRDGRVGDATVSFERAADLFRQSMQSEDRAAVNSSLANMSRVSGNVTAGWISLGAALRDMSAIRSARRRATVLLNASLFASDSQLPYAALAFQALSLDAARDRGTANTMVEALVRRARLRQAVGDAAGATRDLSAADDWMTRVESPASRRYQSSWLKLTKAQQLDDVDPAQALDELEAVRLLFEQIEPVEVPRVHLLRAQLMQRLGRNADSEMELQRGIATQEARLRRFHDGAMAVSYQDALAGLFDQYLDLLITEERWSEAFQLSERARRLANGDSARDEPSLTSAQLSDWANSGPDVLYFAVTATRVCRWLFADGRINARCSSTPRGALDAFVRSWRSSIADGAESQPHPDFLFTELLGAGLWQNSAKPLLIIPDGSLHRLSFAALRDSGSGKYLIEARPITQTVSAAAAIRAQQRARHVGDAGRVLVVGQGAIPGLPLLSEVSDETSEVASAYGRQATLLAGAGATFSDAVRALSVSRILHFAGHAEANPVFPWRSTLFFSPEPSRPTGAVTASEISALPLGQLQLVVLSACSTGDGGLFQGTGVVSLASMFLSAGVPAVVASLWEVDDHASSELLLEFHRRIAAGSSIAEALRASQLRLLTSTQLHYREPRYWAAFVASAPVPAGNQFNQKGS